MSSFKESKDVPLPSDDDDEDEEDASILVDEDIVNAFELEQSFPVKYQIADESAVSLKQDFVLSLCHDGSFTRIAAGLSNAAVQIFDVSSERGLTHSTVDCIPAPSAPNNAAEPINVCGVRFLDQTANCLLVGSTNGLVRLFDLRTQSEQARFEADTAACVSGVSGKTITCFDRNANARIVCAGTEVFQGNVFLLFYDVRERAQLGGYYESHQDDVTDLSFHPRNADILCSGSTDGLINVFDIKETSEDDALLATINTESSVHKINWHLTRTGKDTISCITHTNDFKVYDADDGNELGDFGREHVTAVAKRRNPSNCNLVRAHNMDDGGVFLLAGTNFNRGDVLRSMRLQDEQLVPFANFTGNKQIVRESIFDVKTGAIVTGGESGIVTLWRPQTTAEATRMSSSQLKKKTKSTTHKKTPY